MKTIISIKAKEFQKNAGVRFLWGYISSAKAWNEDKKIIINTNHRWRNRSALWTVYKSIQAALKKDGVVTITIK